MMPKFLRRIGWEQVLPRVFADFTLVHLSMIGAFAVSVLYRTATYETVEARELIANFSHYYMGFFWLLSPIFPVVFYLNGFYTRARGYAGPYKSWVILRGVLIAVMAFYALNYVFFGETRVGRSVSVPFVVLAGAALAGSRLAKGYLESRYEVRPKKPLAVVNSRGSVLVVGGAGYIGSLLVERLLERGYHVRVLDMLLYGDESLRDLLGRAGFELLVGDCRNIQDVVRAVQGVDSVVHLAAIVGDPACELDRETALQINYAATRMLIEVAKGQGVRRFLFASSCSVYGATDLEMDENSHVQPVSLYGRTKLESERALLAARSHTFQPTILRYATVFGLSRRPRFDLVVNLLTAKARQEGVITIYNGQQWRPFIHVRDLVEATVRILEAPTTVVGGEIFNVGDSRLNHTLNEIGEVIREVFPETRVEYVESADPRNYRVSFEKLRTRIGFRARYALRDGILEIKRAFDEGLIEDYTDPRYHNHRLLRIAGSPSSKGEFDRVLMKAFAARVGGG
jgi:nucleoside-diphosphate-sugar epimerase